MFGDVKLDNHRFFGFRVSIKTDCSEGERHKMVIRLSTSIL